jgi:hypothetical protein
MARDIAEGYTNVTERSLRSLTRVDLDQLTFELDRHLRARRGYPAARDDIPAIQLRNRKIQRINTAVMIVRSYRAKART